MSCRILKWLWVACLIPALALASSARADALSEAAGSYRIEPSSRIAFHVGQIAGGGIDGDFAQFHGTFSIDGRDVGRSKVSITLIPASVRAREKRVENFLRSDAVFDVENFPEITFQSTSVTRTGEASARIDGVLTARGKTRKAQFEASVSDRNRRNIIFHVQGKVLRSPYGMDVGTPIYSNVVEFDMVLRGRRG
ncbi:MAG: YceI family protein [Pseudaminobacter sp.]